MSSIARISKQARRYASFGSTPSIQARPLSNLGFIIIQYQSQTIRAQSIFSGAIAAQAISNTIQAQAISSGAIKTQY